MKPNQREVGSAKLVPTLDGEGWIRYSGKDKLDRLMAYFFTSDTAQSTLYFKKFMTYQTLSAINNSNIGQFRDDLEEYLRDYLNKFFVTIKVDVYTTTLDGKDMDLADLDGAIGIRCEIEYVDEGKHILYEKDTIYKDGVFSYVLDKFNNGV